MTVDNTIPFQHPKLWQNGYDTASQKFEPQLVQLAHLKCVNESLYTANDELSDENEALHKTNCKLCDEVNQLLKENSEILVALFLLTQNCMDTAKGSVELKTALDTLEKFKDKVNEAIFSHD